MLTSWGPVVKLRNAARSMGLTRVLAKYLRSADYEERFGKAMLGAIRAGDTVWDVGANVGFYTDKFAAAVGDGGRVVAFEPSPACFAELTKAFAGRPNIRLVNAGLGSTSGTAAFDIGDGSAHPDARIIENPAAGGGANVVQLPIYTGDDAIRSENLATPTFMKVDVEGFELDVLRGMGGILRSDKCREVFVEVHFAILAQRGKADAPDEIVRLLKGAGYRVKWVDSSHVHATRA